MYSAVVLTYKSREICLDLSAKHIPESVAMDEVLAHHMTIKMGPLLEEQIPLLNQSVRLLIDGYGFNDKVVALRISNECEGGKLSLNSIPHVTIAVNRALGGKPVMSNYIEKWNLIESPVFITGTIKEIK